jgi:integrase family protein
MRNPLKVVHADDAPDTLIDAWTLTMQAQGLSQATITERTRLIHQLARTTGTDPAALTPHTLTVFLAAIDSPVTADAYYSIARAWCSWLVRAGHRDDDPTMRVPRPRVPPARPRPITRPQLDTLLATPLRQDTRTKILLAAYAGLRIHEIAKIRGEDIDPAGGTLTVTGKGGRTDLLPAHPIILTQAASYPRKGHWFPSPTRPGQHVAAKTVGTVIARALRRSGIDATAHQLRHFFATSLLEAGVDSRIVQTLMRHASLATTGRYLGVTLAQQRQALTGLRIVASATLDSDPAPGPK